MSGSAVKAARKCLLAWLGCSVQLLLCVTVSGCTLIALHYEDRNHDLIWAAYDGDLGKVRVLLSKGAAVDCWEGDNHYSPLIMAILQEHADVIDQLLSAGANVNMRAANGRTPLMVAASIGNTSLVVQLLRYGANMELEDRDGKTALMVAAEGGGIAVVKALLDAGVKVNAVDLKGWSAVTYAQWKGNEPIANLLVSKAGR